jgi:hypothetical protein
MIGHPLKDQPLIVGGLIVAAYAKVDRRTNAIGVYDRQLFRGWNLWRNDAMDRDSVELFRLMVFWGNGLGRQ